MTGVARLLSALVTGSLTLCGRIVWVFHFHFCCLDTRHLPLVTTCPGPSLVVRPGQGDNSESTEGGGREEDGDEDESTLYFLCLFMP
jgi:hypothetical protein